MGQSLIEFSCCEGVVIGPVSGAVFNMVIFTQPSQALGIKILMYLFRNLQSIDPHFFKIHSVSGGAGFHKTVVKGDVMAYEDVILTEIKKIRDDSPAWAGAGDHIVGNAGQICNGWGNGILGMNKFHEPLGNPAVPYLQGSDFDDLVFLGVQTGCLHIKCDV